VEDAFDHKNLNVEVPEFKDLNPTAENIAVVIFNKIRPKLDKAMDLKITLYETPRNFVTYSGN
jgi:6-pyruvoyltetrahydropterin/6-carboxytetrahydropterin synthase